MNKPVLYIGTIALIILGIILLIPRSSVRNLNKIAVSIAPIASIAESIVGENFDIVQILPPGASPHSFEPSARDKEVVSDASTLFVVGLELDQWAENLISNESTVTINLSDSVLLNEVEHAHSHGEEEEEHDDEKEENEEHSFDPHYWLDTQNAELIASRILEEAIKLQPENRSTFEENYKTFQDELDGLRVYASDKLGVYGSKEAITFHDSFGYFAEENGIEILASIEPFPGKEPSAAYLEKITTEIQLHNVKALFKEPQLSDGVIKSVADDFGATIYTLDPVGGVEGRKSYIDMMKYNIDTFSKAFFN